MVLEYRPSVVVVFTNEFDQILLGERADSPGAWQLPQGGIEPGESALNAVYREMREELGCDRFHIIKEASGLVKYRFPDDLNKPIAKKWTGQSQVWFKARFEPGFGPDKKQADGEFSNFDWRDVMTIVPGVIEWKRDAYREGLRNLGFSIS